MYVGWLLDVMESAFERCLSLRIEPALVDPEGLASRLKRASPELAFEETAGADREKRRQAEGDGRYSLLAKAIDGKLRPADLRMRRGVHMLAFGGGCVTCR